MVIPRTRPRTTMSAIKIVGTLRDEGIGSELVGPDMFAPTHVAAIDSAGEFSLSFYIGKDTKQVKSLRNCVLLCRDGLSGIHDSVSRIVVEDPRLAFAIIAQEFLPPLPERWSRVCR